MRVLISTAIIILGLALSASAVSASNHNVPPGAHYQTVDCVDNNGSITCSGNIVGLGNRTVTATLAIAQDVTVECTNPGGQLVEAQTQFVSATSQELTSSGNNLTFSITAPAQEPTFANARAAGCPNGRWSFEVVSSDITGYTLYWCFGNRLITNLTVNAGGPAPSC